MVIGVRVETGLRSQPHGEVVTLDGVIASEVIFGARGREEPPRVNSVVLTTRRRATQGNHVERTRYPSGDDPQACRTFCGERMTVPESSEPAN